MLLVVMVMMLMDDDDSDDWMSEIGVVDVAVRCTVVVVIIQSWSRPSYASVACYTNRSRRSGRPGPESAGQCTAPGDSAPGWAGWTPYA
jgi:hypothetical protein